MQSVAAIIQRKRGTEMTNQEKAIQAVNVICKSAKLHVINTEEVHEGLTPLLEDMADEVADYYGLEESVMDDYRKEMAVFDGKWESIEVEHITHEQAEETREIIYEMCDAFDRVKDAMKYVRIVAEMLYVWNPLLVN